MSDFERAPSHWDIRQHLFDVHGYTPAGPPDGLPMAGPGGVREEHRLDHERRVFDHDHGGTE